MRHEPVFAARFYVNRSKTEKPAHKCLVDVHADNFANLQLGDVPRENAAPPDDLPVVHAQDRGRAHGESPEQGRQEQKGQKQPQQKAGGRGEFQRRRHADDGRDLARQPVYFKRARAASREIEAESNQDEPDQRDHLQAWIHIVRYIRL